MRILHVTNHFAPCTGGIEQHVKELCLQLRARGHETDVLCLNRCSDGSPLPRKGREGGIGITRVPHADLKYYKVAGDILPQLRGYDVIHIHGLGYFLDYLTLTKGTHKKPLILSTHGGFFHTPALRAVKRVHYHTFTRLALRRVDRLVAVSPHDARVFGRLRKDAVVIPNGISAKDFRPRKKENSSFAYVGRLAPNKRVDLLIRTLAAVHREKPLHLTIAGPDPHRLRPALERLAAEQGLPTAFLGEIDDSAKRRLLARTQYFASASAYEGFGIAAVEAMAAGCVPLLNKIPAFEDVLGGAGLATDFSYPEHAARAILLFLPKHPAEWGGLARARAQLFDWSRVMGAWEEVYRQAAGEWPRAGV